MFTKFKDRRYWILMPPFLIIGFILVLYLPQKLKPFAILTALVFWIVYYTWNGLSKTNEEKEEMDK
ncbi:MAG: hypothetical protein AB2374_00785 [Cytobacillus gottheilii]|uniref:hypothetical protein n=1 Tax=Cytobacillus gottheilii TaxID=859144 RepID=UPI00082B5E2D|nr:hypothetical protein [Cytobacillus gottheilii]